MRISSLLGGLALAACSPPVAQHLLQVPDRPGNAEEPVLVGRVSEWGTGRAIAEARIRLANTAIGTVSDSLGQYVIPRAPRAEHTVIVYKTGYLRQQHDIAFFRARAETLDVALRRNPRSVD